MDPILDDLNQAQQQAVNFGEGPLMVLAGAGSGKTRVITRRVARLLRDGVAPESILAVTFTNKAAEEMARRVRDLGGGRVHISTFHSACARFLRQHAHHLGFPRSFSIFDTYDRDSCVKTLIKERGLSTDGFKPAHVGQLISRLKNHGTSPAEYQEAHGADDVVTLEEMTAEIYGPYQERMAKLGAMDFDDLLGRFLQLMREHPEVAEGYRRRFEWVMVDEFQDTNRIQYDLTTQLAAGHRNLCVVGDPDQSIYRFRGAEIRNILDFQRDYPDVHVTRLETNYRSTRCILRAAQGVIVRNQQRLERHLDSNGEEGDLLTYKRHPNPFEENDGAVKRVLELLQQRVPPEEIAVFYRSHFLSRGLEEVMRRAAVPYQIIGGLSFFERREIKDVLAYLRVAINPLDDVSMERIINVPPRRIGKATLDKFRAIATREQVSMFELTREPSLHGELSAAARKGLKGLAEVFDEVSKEADVGAADALRAVLDGTRYVEYTSSLGDPQDIARQENVEELLNDAADFDRRFGGGLAAYLEHVSLLTSDDRRQRSGPTVSLMTIHAAKGLEFDHVLMVGLEDGLFPSSRATSDADIEEERRLMYVALTRARRSLWLSSCERRMVQGTEMDQVASRFIEEIPPDCLDDQSAGSEWHDWEATYEDEPLPDLHPGTRVRHPEYGDGVVARLSGRGFQARVVVGFDDGDERTLMLEYAKLEVLSEGGDLW